MAGLHKKIHKNNFIHNIKKNIYYNIKYYSIYNNINITKNKEFDSISNELIIEYNFNRYFGPQKYVCFAPFNSLFFDIRGKIVVCNNNRKFVLGDIRNTTIKEAWNSNERKKLQEHIKHHDFSLGCSMCKDSIEAQNYDSIYAMSYDSSTTIPKDYPTRLEFEIENTCNLACKTCINYLSSTYKKHYNIVDNYLSPYDDSFLEQLDEFIPHIEFAQFSGGEPFLIENYYKILEKIAELNSNCKIHIQTNGLVLNNRVKKILEKCKCNIGISLDATTNEVYEKIRIKGNFDRLKENLAYFYNYCEENNTHFSLTFAPTNIACYEIPDAIMIANQYETNLFLNVVWEPINVAIWSMSSTELESLYEYYLTIELPQETPIQQKNNRQFEHLKNHVLLWIKQAKEREQYKKDLELQELHELQELLLTNLINFNKDNLYDWLTGTKIEDARTHYINKLNQLNTLDKNLQKELTINLLSYAIESTYREVNNYLHLYI